MGCDSTRKVKLRDEDIGDTIDAAWGWLPKGIARDAQVEPLRDIYDLKKEVKDLEHVVEDHDDALEVERAKVKELEEQLSALQLQLKLAHVASKRPCHDPATDPVARPSSPPTTAPLPARATSGLMSRLSAPTPMSTEGQSAPSDAAYGIPEGWESDSSIRKTYELDRAQHVAEQPKKKCKKLHGTPNTVNGLAIARESAISAYLAASPLHTINDPALQRQIALIEAQYIGPHMDLPGTVHPPYPGEGVIIPLGDPPISETGLLPPGLSTSQPAGYLDLDSQLRLLDLFGSTDQWSNLVDARECLTPQSTSLRLSITGPYPVGGRAGPDIPLTEITRWLACYAGITHEQVARIEQYVQCSLTGAAFSAATQEGQQKVLKTSHMRAAVPQPLTHTQLDQELACFQPSPQAEDPAVEAMLRKDTGLVNQAETPASGEAAPPHPTTPADAEVPPEESRAPPAPYDDDGHRIGITRGRHHG
ncbi:hypothetical protein JB92DRAFT_3112205 [Gautieria morchelliformis]|nr:hypothetical protein JB92DRAFT_3112205 [Gautieria morchelliformis]